MAPVCVPQLPLLGCFLFGLPLGVISLMCYGMCTAEADDGADDMELMKREGFTDEEEEDDEEEEEKRRQAAKLEEYEDEEGVGGMGGELQQKEEKSPEEKKAD
ncbi:hypothetical protein AALO_G00212210 [Alosa alosa]|uniref:protein disulfide-isomerase n=1 Tax=Alosa alosa TaxID=278164 RepID=A0AAV6FZZ5_9TELE|nr:hypothetical protein AALO_G00212210 [Alosa alosa]